MKHLTVGSLAYFDSFAGLIPVRVVSITGTSGLPSTLQTILASVTKTTRGYALGETLESSGLHIIPRTSVHTRSGQYRIRTDYTVIAS